MRDFGTGAQVVVAVAGMVPADLELVVPVGVGHIAIAIARARFII